MAQILAKQSVLEQVSKEHVIEHYNDTSEDSKGFLG